MSYFCCCHARVMMLLLLCTFIFFLQSPPPVVAEAAAAEPGRGDKSGLLELWSREEIVQMAGYGEEKLSTVLVTGSLHCEEHNNLHAHHHHHQPHAWPIPGASVVVRCHSHGSRVKGESTVARGVTDEFGDFIIDLPSYLHAIPNLEKICNLRVHHIPEHSKCKPAKSVKRHKKLTLSSFGNGIRTYSAGSLRFQHSTNSKPLPA